MNKNLNKKSQSGLAAIIISLFVLTSSAFLATNITLNGSAVSDMQFENFIEKAVDIEIWANTSIKLEIINNNINALLTLDNQTILPEQEVEFYLNENLIAKEKTDSEGYAKSMFNLYTINPGNYSLTATFQGSSALYLNPSSITIENIVLGETNQTLNITNITFEGSCQEFSEQILWSSSYSNDLEGSTNYQTWYPKYNCTEIGENCFIGNIEIQTRFLYFGENNEQGEGYIQISNPDESICGNPEQGNYSNYLAYEILHGESRKSGQSCGNNKNLDAKCGVDLTDGFENPLICYGIKAHASQNFIVDAFEIKYTLCEKNA